MAHAYTCKCCGHRKWYDDILKSAVTLCTFPVQDKKYYCREFGVPKEWLRKTLYKLNFKMKMETFLDEYTWDTTHIIFHLAEVDGVILWKHNQR